MFKVVLTTYLNITLQLVHSLGKKPHFRNNRNVFSNSCAYIWPKLVADCTHYADIISNVRYLSVGNGPAQEIPCLQPAIH